MSRFERVCKGGVKLVRWFFGGNFGGYGRAQVAAIASRLRDCRDGVFEDQLIMRSRFQQDRKLIKTPDATCQFSSIDKIDHNRRFFAADCIEKGVLNVLGSRFSV